MNELFIDDLLKKVGRNVLLFQQLEQLLKFVVANGSLAGFASELSAIKHRQADRVRKQTMGTLVGQYVAKVNPESDVPFKEPKENHDAFFSFSFRVECDGDYYEARKKALAQLVTDRNDLIHHLLPRFDAKSKESCEALCKELDAQSDNIRLEIKRVLETAKALIESRKKLVSQFQSDEGIKEVQLSFLRQSRLVLMLRDIATQMSRDDGWILLSSAGHLVKEHAPKNWRILEKYMVIVP